MERITLQDYCETAASISSWTHKRDRTGSKDAVYLEIWNVDKGVLGDSVNRTLEIRQADV